MLSLSRILFLLAFAFLAYATVAAELSVASYNVEFYLDQDEPTLKVSAKTEAAKAKIQETIKKLDADVVALQEMSTSKGLNELQSALQKQGVSYPYIELMPSADPNLRLAYLSRLPILAQHRYTNENYLLRGRRHTVARGFFAIEVQPPGGPRCAIINVHFKSQRQLFTADDAEMREQEALQLKERIAQLTRDSRGNLIVAGDFNDSIDSRPLRILVGRGANRLFDVRPAEQNGDTGISPDEKFTARNIVWTHYFSRDETYSRLDYILVSSQMFERLDRGRTHIATIPDWGVGSDHRAIKATFQF
ncbi:MAG: endonuclease/exonuclease/phosphatase family protein [Verrucomicrobiales bacterium]